ncbi:hypothetical protein [Streptomyces chartreusis]|uniref:hypothetical protein n=1 Tax=Streptomyces chartreusis TaxID=1969 RepID=UPI00382BC248
MSASEGGGESSAVHRARVLRLETLRDLEALMYELSRLQDELVACIDDEEEVRDLLHAAGVMSSVWLDDVACRFAGADHQADELFAIAWRLLDELDHGPGGFRSREDAALFASLRGSAAGMLARLWISGYLMGPVPHDAWPNPELALLLLRALEHRADALALSDALEYHYSQPPSAGLCPDENSQTDHEPDGPEQDPL